MHPHCRADREHGRRFAGMSIIGCPDCGGTHRTGNSVSGRIRSGRTGGFIELPEDHLFRDGQANGIGILGSGRIGYRAVVLPFAGGSHTVKRQNRLCGQDCRTADSLPCIGQARRIARQRIDGSHTEAGIHPIHGRDALRLAGDVRQRSDAPKDHTRP